MSDTYISAELRRLVTTRAQRRCEYCLVHEDDTFFGFQLDHIISEKHGGATTADNLAQACTACNASKGSDIAAIENGQLVPFFNPRTDLWSDHFRFDGPHIEGLTDVGRATARLLGFNHPRRIDERRATMSLE